MGKHHKVIFLHTVQEFQAMTEVVLGSSAFVWRALKLGGEKTVDPIIVLWVVHPAIRIEDNQRVDSTASVFHAKLHAWEDEDSFLRPQLA